MKRLAVLLVPFLLVPLLQAAPTVAAPAESGAGDAATAARGATRHPITRTYIKQWIFHPKGAPGAGLNNKCVRIQVQGTMKGSWYQMYGDDAHGGDRRYITFEKLRIVNPNITAVAWPEVENGGCDSTRPTKLSGYLQQGFYASKCNIDVDLAVGAGASSDGWSVGVSASPSYSCSDDKVGWIKDEFPRLTKTMGTYTSGIPLTWDVTSTTKELGVGFQGTWDVSACFRQGPCDHWRQPLNVTLKP